MQLNTIEYNVISLRTALILRDRDSVRRWKHSSEFLIHVYDGGDGGSGGMGHRWVGGSNSRSIQQMENRKVNKLVSLSELYDMLEVAVRQRVHCDFVPGSIRHWARGGVHPGQAPNPSRGNPESQSTIHTRTTTASKSLEGTK